MTVRSIQGLLACAIATAACTGGSGTQVITGHVDVGKGALAVRAIADTDVVTATPVRSDGTFTLSLPSGTSYRLEVLTTSGVKNVVMRSGNVLRDLSFKVCQPKDPFDIGGMGDPNPDGLCMPGDPNCEPCDPMAGMECGTGCGPNDPNCMQPPPGCDPMTDPTCACNADGTCGPTCDPSDPNCMCDPDGNCVPPTCDPAIDPMCPPPPSCQPGDPNCCDPMTQMCEPPPHCDPTTDPMCTCNADGTCPPPPQCAPNDPMCCYANNTCPPPDCTDPNAPGCQPPCVDPMDPTSCTDPCANDPATCGCMANTADCWPQPEPCCDPNGTVGMCDPGQGMEPDNVPGDFGCE